MNKLSTKIESVCFHWLFKHKKGSFKQVCTLLKASKNQLICLLLRKKTHYFELSFKLGASLKKLSTSVRTRRGQSIKIDIGKPIDKSITIDINHLIVIDCIDQSIKIDTHNSFGNY